MLEMPKILSTNGKPLCSYDQVEEWGPNRTATRILGAGVSAALFEVLAALFQVIAPFGNFVFNGFDHFGFLRLLFPGSFLAHHAVKFLAAIFFGFRHCCLQIKMSMAVLGVTKAGNRRETIEGKPLCPEQALGLAGTIDLRSVTFNSF
ncbi:MAG: hypothetical protein EPN97_02745 [Alphaproteobacteria bacterium]|nr:MAG: hypothetical protein EPN97_02745 [Alphaproteobacteria bacterium]